MKRRATSILFAVASTSTTVAVADPPSQDPAKVEPRTLASGAPACGNVMFKSYGPRPPCTTTAQVILTVIAKDLREIASHLAVFDVFADRSLTLAEGRRPRS